MEILDSGQQRLIRLLIGLSVMAPVLAATASAQTLDEYDVKAAFLYNFTKFVQWPDIPSPDAFNICILGDDPFGGALDKLVKGKSVENRKIQIRRLKEPLEARQCQIVFVRRQEEAKAEKLLEAVRGMQVLTVSERQKFAELGGMVILRETDGRVGIGINSRAAESAGLKLSAKLLTLAKHFKDESEGP